MKNLHLRLHTGTCEEWDTFAQAFGTLFHTSHWLRHLERAQHCHVERLGVFDGDRLLGILPLVSRRMFPFRIAASPFSVEGTPYLGLAIDPTYIDDSLLCLAAYARTKRIDFVRLLQWRDPQAFAPHLQGLIHLQSSHVLNLSAGTDALWQGLSRKCRNHVRKAQKSDVVVSSETGEQSFSEFYALYSELFEAQHMRAPLSEEFFSSLRTACGEGGTRLFAARLHGEMIAAAIVLFGFGRAYYAYGASSKRHNHLSPSNLVQWSAITELKELGIEHYDFVGSNIPRLAEFKASFGGTLTHYSLIEIAANPLAAFARRQYPRIQHLERQLRKVFSGSSGPATAENTD